MQVRVFALIMGAAIAGVAVLGAAIPSGAQVVATACTSTTATFIQAVGASAAPVLVPMNVPVTECTLSHKVQVIIPAFRVVGQPASILVPTGLPAVACASNVVVVSSAGSTSQVLTVSGSPVTVLSPATVVALPATCF